jgi:hypothetical protein
MKNKKSISKSAVVHKPVAETSKRIEESYAAEKRKIDNAVLELEKERLKSYIDLSNKRVAMLILKRKKLDELGKDLAKHTVYLKNQIRIQGAKKEEEKGRFDRLYTLNEHLKQIESQVKDVAVSRKVLLQREKDLLSGTKKFFDENKEDIQRHGLTKFKKVEGVLDKKSRILAETAHLMDEDLNSIFLDKRLLEKITDKQLDSVYQTNLKLKNLTEEYRKILREKQELKTEEFEFIQMLKDVKKKRDALIGELKALSNKVISD